MGIFIFKVLALYILGYILLQMLSDWLLETSEIEKPAAIYTTKTIGHYKADYEQIKSLIGQAKTLEQIKHLFNAVYSFRVRYRHFTNYGVDVEKTTDQLISLIDERLTALKCNTPKTKLLNLFF
jgi:hypothetical protein